MPPDPPLLQVRDLAVTFKPGGMSWLSRGRSPHRAVDGVSFTLRRGETVGIVGESGSGKTTVGRTILRLQAASAGQVLLDGEDITAVSGSRLRALRRRMQMVFQDPLSSLNPRQTIRTALATPLRVHRLCPRDEIAERVARMLRRVGLPEAAADRYPHELSGGQVQRVAIGRALLLSPGLLLADEAVSKLDVSVRAQVLNLFKDIQEEHRLGVIFITHDLDVARFLSDQVLVMYFGQVVECGPPDILTAAPLHPYTRALVEADPGATPGRTGMTGSTGCRFHDRCPIRMARCAVDTPALEPQGGTHAVACWAVNPEPARVAAAASPARGGDGGAVILRPVEAQRRGR